MTVHYQSHYVFWQTQKFNHLITQISSEMEWKEEEKDVWLPYAWENVPLIVKTVSAIGSNDEIFFEVSDTAGNSFARVVVRMSTNPIYYVRWCYNDTPLRSLPDAPDNVRIWKFVKFGFVGLKIECNGFLVAEIRFDAARSECSASQWKTTEVNFIKFNPDWDKTVGVAGTFVSNAVLVSTTNVINAFKCNLSSTQYKKEKFTNHIKYPKLGKLQQ